MVVVEAPFTICTTIAAQSYFGLTAILLHPMHTALPTYSY
jgi:hypothetical protein